MLNLRSWSKLNIIMEQKKSKYSTWLVKRIGKIDSERAILDIIAKVIKIQEFIMIKRWLIGGITIEIKICKIGIIEVNMVITKVDIRIGHIKIGTGHQ